MLRFLAWLPLLVLSALAAEVAKPTFSSAKYYKDIAAFESADKATPPPQGALLLSGASSLRLWKTAARDFSPYPLINRGFGGSRIYDSVFWSDRLVARYQPSAIVVFAGTNDISGDEPRSAAFVAEGFDALVEDLRRQGTEAPIAYIAISPAPSRARHQQIVEEANRLIAAIAAGRFCVATALPSYRAFADHALLVDSLAEGIDAACAMPPDRIARAVREGQEVVVRCFTPEVVGRRWVEVLSALKP